MRVLPFLSGLVKPITDIVDQVVPDKDLSAKLKQEMTVKMLDADSEIAKAGAKVVLAEVGGESWLQRNWRPMLMVWFSTLIGVHWFGYTPENLSEDVILSLFTLVNIGIGGYVIGRSGEKIANTIAPALSHRG